MRKHKLTRFSFQAFSFQVRSMLRHLHQYWNDHHYRYHPYFLDFLDFP